MSNKFSWKTKFKSIIIVDGELFGNEYSVKISLTPHTANLKEQTEYFDRLKNLFELVFANTITTWRGAHLLVVSDFFGGDPFFWHFTQELCPSQRQGGVKLLSSP